MIRRLVLGLDISSAATGYALIDAVDGRALSLGRIAPPRKCDRYSGVEAVVDLLMTVVNAASTSASLSSVGAEDYLRMFAVSRRGLYTLAEVNTLTLYRLYQSTGVRADRIHATSARKAVGLSAARGAIKMAAWKYMIRETETLQTTREHRLVGVDHWTVQYDRAGQLAQANFDVSDAFVIAQATRLTNKTTTITGG